MSIFSRISRSRQQAKEHNAKVAAQQKKEDVKTPYKHVPTHAASDAIASAPPSWRDSDRSRIQEENRRRSAMAASGHHMNMPGIPRVGSNLSHVSFPTDVNVNTTVRVPRAYSYTGMSPYSSHNGSRDVVYSLPDVTTAHYATSSKGKEVSRQSYEAPRISPTYQKAESGSSSGSSSSQDDLEIRPARGPALRPAPVEPAHRLHPSRRISDSSIDRIAMANNARVSRDSRPPMSMRGFTSISTVANAPVPMRSPSPGAYAPSPMMSSRQEPGQIPTSNSYPVAEVTPATQDERTLDWLSQPGQSQERVATEPVPVVSSVNSSQTKERKRPKSTRFTELEPIDSYVETHTRNDSYTAKSSAPAPVANNRYVVNVFPEEESIPEPESKSKSKRFSRSSGKLKKSRWASSKATAVAV
ncbi:hypothetical protein PT974_01094 [Cladobotryum mycophilum]|uniref:Uncharacterized protein n=1 Tax=Cladobotryum mycophilum TaxID=491253 RepID=A0ABR0T2R6_9HYPO